MVLQVLVALREVHDKLLLHGDLSPKNVLIGEDGRLKLALGSAVSQESIEKGDNLKSQPTWGYAEKDAREGKYSEASEVYSFACLTYLMLTGKSPFTRDDEKTYIINYACFDYYRRDWALL